MKLYSKNKASLFKLFFKEYLDTVNKNRHYVVDTFDIQPFYNKLYRNLKRIDPNINGFEFNIAESNYKIIGFTIMYSNKSKESYDL